ncbi:MAG: creatininase family protein [Chloroflexota bacterium]
MLLEDLNWMDVERYLQTDDRIILVTGATEQHAYLSLLTDILIPAKIAAAVGEREKVLVAPPLNFGYSREFSYFPGTISITRQTFDFVLLEIVESLLHQGFRQFFIVNGHGGNLLPDRLHDFVNEDEVQVVWYDWRLGKAVRDFEHSLGLRFSHANWGENFPFTRCGDVPDGEKPLLELPDEFEDPQAARDLLGDGSFGGPYQISDDQMQTLFANVVNEATALVHQMSTPKTG